MSTQVQQIAEEQRDSTAMVRLVRRLHISNNIAVGIIWAVAGLVALLFLAIIVDLLVQGFTSSAGSKPALLDPTFWGVSQLGIVSEIFNTFYILILTEIFLVPIALGAAIYTVEYARQGPLITVIRFAAETLAGVPSIVLGLFGFILFASVFQFHISRLAGALTFRRRIYAQPVYHKRYIDCAYLVFEDAGYTSRNILCSGQRYGGGGASGNPVDH
jgi:phosphate transport system permease protein